MRIPCGLATCACIYIQAATLLPQKIARCARAFSGNPVGAPSIQAHVATTEPTEKHKNNRAPKKYRRTFWEEETERSSRGGLRKQIARKAQFTATRSAAERGIALNRLRLPRAFRRAVPDFLSAFQFAFGIFAIVSLLTCPMYSPSSQQPKESARINFLPSSP